jgi:hypothetical protein
MLRSFFTRAARFPRPALCARRGLLTQAYSVGPTEACMVLNGVVVETDSMLATVAREDGAAAL